MILRRASPLVHLFRYACSTTIVCRGKKNAKKKAPDLPPLDPVPARVDPCLATLVDKLPRPGLDLRGEMERIPADVHVEPGRVRSSRAAAMTGPGAFRRSQMTRGGSSCKPPSSMARRSFSTAMADLISACCRGRSPPVRDQGRPDRFSFLRSSLSRRPRFAPTTAARASPVAGAARRRPRGCDPSV